MIKNSCFYKACAFAIAIIKVLWNVFKNSVFYAVLTKLFDFVSDMYSKSVFCFAFTRKPIEQKSTHSLIYKVAHLVFVPVKKISIWAFSNIDKAKNNGFLEGTCSRISRTTVLGRPFCRLWDFVFSFTGIFPILCLCMFVFPHELWNNLFALVCAFAMAFVLMLAYASKKDYVSITREKLWLGLVFFMASIVFSSFVSHDRADSFRVLAFYITSFVMCLCVSAFLNTKQAMDRFLGVMYFVTVVIGIVGVVQGIIGVEESASLTDLELNKDMPGRIYSTLGNPNNFAQIIVLFLPFSFVYTLKKKHVLGRITLFAFLVLPVVSLVMTYSRSGWIAFVFSVAVFVVLYKPKLVYLGTVLIFIAVPFLPQSVINRILTIGNLSDSSSSYRIDIWSGCVEMLKKWWICGLGVGPEAFSKVFPSYAPGTLTIASHSHMMFMEMMTEAGIAGLVSYTFLVIELIRRACIGAKRSLCGYNRAVCAASAASISGLVLTGLFEYSWFYPRVMFAFFICAGVVMASFTVYEKNR